MLALGLGLGLPFKVQTAGQAGPILVQKWDAMEVSAFGTAHTATLAAPCATGSAVVLGLLDDPFRTYTCTDDEGNTYTEVYNQASVAYDKRGVYFVCASVAGNPQTITITSSGNCVLRLYTWNWLNLTATVAGSQMVELASQTSATASITPNAANSVMFTMFNTSPSVTPVATAPATIYRLNTQSGGAPYSGPLSQSAAFDQCGDAGVAHTIGMTWPEVPAVALRGFSVALAPVGA